MVLTMVMVVKKKKKGSDEMYALIGLPPSPNQHDYND